MNTTDKGESNKQETEAPVEVSRKNLRGFSDLTSKVIRNHNRFFKRNQVVSKIVIASSGTIENADAIARRYEEENLLESFHYYIDRKGTIVGCVSEDFISNATIPDIDEKSINIMLGNSADDQIMKPISDECMEALVSLLIDICQRNRIGSLEYTMDTTGNLIPYDCFFERSASPGPYVRSKLLEISYRVSNHLMGLPDKPKKDSGFFRVRKNRKARSLAIYPDFNEAVYRAWKSQANVYDNQGFEVFNWEKSSPVTLWDNYIIPQIGDRVKSVTALILMPPGTNRPYVKKDGIYCVYAPELGGYVPMNILNETAESKARNKDGRLHAGKTLVEIEEGKIEKVNHEEEKYMVHGHWFPRDALLIKRR